MQEEVLFQEDNVTVTSKRLIILNTTYAISGITSVRYEAIHPIPITPRPPSTPLSKKSKIILSIIFIFFSAAFAPLLIIIVPLLIMIVKELNTIKYPVPPAKKSEYKMYINFSSLETQTLSSENEYLIRDVVSALNNAISMWR